MVALIFTILLAVFSGSETKQGLTTFSHQIQRQIVNKVDFTISNDALRLNNFIQLQPNSSGLPTVEYPKGKVTLKNGGVPILGKTVRVYSDRIDLELSKNNIKSFPIEEVRMVEGKGRKPRVMAAACGFGCMGLLAGSYLSTGGEFEDPNTGEITKVNAGEYFLGGILWSTISAGVGGLVGLALDEWTVIYLGN